MATSWEFETEEQSLLALAGHSTRDDYIADRRARAKELVSTLHVQASHRLFEIGSGDGLVARELSQSCVALDCCDISNSFLRKARETCRDRRNVSFHRIASQGLAMLPPASYDSGFALNVFIHFNLYQVATYLQHVRRLLKPGGIFYFDACTFGPQTRELFSQHLALYAANPDAVGGLLNFNHPETLAAVAEEAGLAIDAVSFKSTEGWIRGIVRRR
jgi:ubiquinone/menaquinone biosynthesis C-methylase UbiE